VARRPGVNTTSVEREHALPLKEAMELVVGEDPRPLLVMRECELCKGTDHALMSRSLDNEQTALLTHWFHCVKLPTNVLEADHPLTLMFKPEKEGDRVPHLFFCNHDGSNKTPLPGDQSQTELWATMFGYLDDAYEGNAKKAVKEMRSLLNQFDRIDNRANEIKARIDREIEKRGPESKRLKKLEAQLAKLEKERVKLLEREKEIRDLALLDMHEPEGSDSSGDSSGG
jgi:hypothetical protein